MEQRPSWETNKFSDIQEIPRILWKPMVYYRFQKSPPPVYSEPDWSSPRPHPISLKSILILPPTYAWVEKSKDNVITNSAYAGKCWAQLL